jgi:GTPase SAR1 family protein
MQLTKARVQNFQAFSDSGEIEFADGFNLIIGPNNVGKSSLLRALLAQLSNDPHRRPDVWEYHKTPPPIISLELAVRGSEIREWILEFGSEQLFPMPATGDGNAEAFIFDLFQRPALKFQMTSTPGAQFTANFPSHGLFIGTPGHAAAARPNSGTITVRYAPSPTDSLPSMLYTAWSREMFYFASERMNIGESSVGHQIRLDPRAANLPIVLQTLASDRPETLRRLVEHVRDIFPTVGNISTRLKPENAQLIEVRVWPTQKMEKVELSVPLNASGTGVSQIIAILAAVMTMDSAVIIIDEINSFLHPAAVKGLLRILQTKYPYHQYIISTHAPEVLSASNPSTCHLVKRSGFESTVQKLNPRDVETFRELSGHLGVSMSDVFAADKVIWVEGPTEELCFPHVYTELAGEPLPSGIVFTSVVATGDFLSRRRDRELVYEVYRRLSSATVSLPVSVAFSFDTEELTESDKQKMEQDSGGRVRLLPRRHFECYLLGASAIAAFIAQRDSLSDNSPTVEMVSDALKLAAETKFLIKQWQGNLEDEEWLTRVDAASLIDEVCGKLSDQRVRFTKKNDSLFLLKHILGADRTKLSSLGAYVKDLVHSVSPAKGNSAS